jgi:hypothetical protein
MYMLMKTGCSREFCVFLTFSFSSVVCPALPHSLGASQHRTVPPFNLHKARVRRNHGRLCSNGLIKRARNILPSFTFR